MYRLFIGSSIQNNVIHIYIPHKVITPLATFFDEINEIPFQNLQQDPEMKPEGAGMEWLLYPIHLREGTCGKSPCE